MQNQSRKFLQRVTYKPALAKELSNDTHQKNNRRICNWVHFAPVGCLQQRRDADQLAHRRHESFSHGGGLHRAGAGIPKSGLTPSPTQCLCPTETLEPTSTAATTQSLPTIIVPGPQGSGTPGTETINLAEWVSQTVSDGTVFEPGETFIITWTMKNAGTSTWTPNYMLRYFSGNAFGAPQEIFLDRDVLPGETVDIAIAMQAPTVPGDYRSDWVMADPFRSNFKTPVYLEITVARPPTATPTATVTPTATRTPTTTITPTVTATP